MKKIGQNASRLKIGQENTGNIYTGHKQILGDALRVVWARVVPTVPIRARIELLFYSRFRWALL